MSKSTHDIRVEITGLIPQEDLMRTVKEGLCHAYMKSASEVKITQVPSAPHRDTGGPDQGGEFTRGMPGHPDNEMGM
jgi:hypothetical protein